MRAPSRELSRVIRTKQSQGQFWKNGEQPEEGIIYRRKEFKSGLNVGENYYISFPKEGFE